ncbi:MAG TPA: 4-hydroxy-tetrahydrodipicolinate synthase [Chthonomonadaceae bacterium]|nr:4-hydroxy-tetrahydrodipicolinate synthase [Chthonomonadaceae bacterium]
MSEAIFGQVVTAMVTPFDVNGRVDPHAAAQLVTYLLDNGSDGIVVSGTTGESPTLTHEEKLNLFRLVKETAGPRGKVIAGTGGNDTASSIALTRKAAEIGVDGALLVVPYYNKPSQEGLYRHFRAIAESVPELPCMLYNVPPRTSQNMEAATTSRLAHDVPNIVAVKEASGNLMQCAEIFRTAPADFALYSGDDGMTLPMLSVGGVGVVSVTAHLVGNDIKAMHTAFFSHRLEEAARLNAKMLPLVRACFQPTTPSPAPVKAALNLLGHNVGGLRLPLVECNEKERDVVRTALVEYGLL